jgi:nucleoid DNA-binding protein
MKSIPPKRLVNAVADAVGATQETVRAVLECALEAIKQEAASGKTVMIRGFGTFYTSTRKGGKRGLPSDMSKVMDAPTTKRLSLRSPAEKVDES